MGTAAVVLFLVSVLVTSPTVGEMSCDLVRMASKVRDTCNNVEVSTACCDTIETIVKLRCLRAVSQQQDVIDGGFTWGFLLDIHHECQAKAHTLNTGPDPFSQKPPSQDASVVTSSNILPDAAQPHAAKVSLIKKIGEYIVEGLEVIGSILGAIAGIVVLWKNFKHQNGRHGESSDNTGGEMLQTSRNTQPRAAAAHTQREAHEFGDTEVRHSWSYRMTRRAPVGEAMLKADDEKPKGRLRKTSLKPKLKPMKKRKVNPVCCNEHPFHRCPRRLDAFHFDGCFEVDETLREIPFMQDATEDIMGLNTEVD